MGYVTVKLALQAPPAKCSVVSMNAVEMEFARREFVNAIKASSGKTAPKRLLSMGKSMKMEASAAMKAGLGSCVSLRLAALNAACLKAQA